ncbi:MAG: CRISPR system precrRNA processing endoribonuclease RAMP protein Cas6, partial [Bryobacteraceae bacterium]
MTFDFHAYRLSFVARESIQFPAVVPANVLRGGFGLMLRRVACECGPSGTHAAACTYARFFEPEALSSGPSGLRDHPRPFVFRARSLDGRTVEAGEPFEFGMNVFETRYPFGERIEQAFSELAAEGLGPTRGRALLLECNQSDLSLELKAVAECVSRASVSFLTPTELKAGDGLAAAPEFAVLFARIRDRVSTLRALYGNGPLDIDFRGMAARAAGIATACCEIRSVAADRHSTRTGQRHGLSGFSGDVEYAGPLDEFLPYLNAAQWTGVGRQTVWGKGELSV